MPFGLETETNASGPFDSDVYAPSFFAPLNGPSYLCRVLSAVAGVPLAEKSITMVGGADSPSRPTTKVSLGGP
jgi:hypothetical protein